jgi:hypothetical protein
MASPPAGAAWSFPHLASMAVRTANGSPNGSRGQTRPGGEPFGVCTKYARTNAVALDGDAAATGKINYFKGLGWWLHKDSNLGPAD